MTLRKLVESHKPTQVKFYDGEDYCTGILFGEWIICGCCGALFGIEDVIEFADEEGIPPVKVFKKWSDLSDEIRGTNSDDSDENYAIAIAIED